MNTKLERIAEIAKKNPEVKFTSLIHHINKETLMECHKELKANLLSPLISLDNLRTFS